MATTVSNLKLGPAEVTFNSNVLGATRGSVRVRLTVDEAELISDQLGTAPAEMVRRGLRAEVVVPVAETTLANLARVIPGSTLVTDAMDATKLKVLLDQAVGQRAVGDSKTATLLIKPLSAADTPTTDANEWVTFNAAYPMANIEASYDNDNQRVWEITFMCLPDSTDSNRIGIFGDTTAAS